MHQSEYDKMVRKHCCELSPEVQIRTGFRTRGEMEKSIKSVLKNKQIMSRFRVEQLADVSLPKLLKVFYSLREAGGQVAFTLDDAGVRAADVVNPERLAAGLEAELELLRTVNARSARATELSNRQRSNARQEALARLTNKPLDDLYAKLLAEGTLPEGGDPLRTPNQFKNLAKIDKVAYLEQFIPLDTLYENLIGSVRGTFPSVNLDAAFDQAAGPQVGTIRGRDDDDEDDSRRAGPSVSADP
jgi:hypothetical protein